MNRFKTKLPSGRVAEYAYPRYFFTNYSEDIRRIFCEHCELIGVRWTQSNPRNISVSHRDSVAILDSFIGPKSVRRLTRRRAAELRAPEPAVARPASLERCRMRRIPMGSRCLFAAGCCVGSRSSGF